MAVRFRKQLAWMQAELFNLMLHFFESAFDSAIGYQPD